MQTKIMFVLLIVGIFFSIQYMKNNKNNQNEIYSKMLKNIEKNKLNNKQTQKSISDSNSNKII